MRLRVLVAACVAIAGSAAASTVPQPSTVPAPAVAEAAEFYIYALPLLEVARRRDELLAKHAPNIWVHTRSLADDRFREVTTPNNDTIYSMAFIDLRNGPARITVPADEGRYLSIHLLDMYSNAIGFAGTRSSGGRPETIILVGPGQRVPTGPSRVVQSPTPWVWGIARVVVNGVDDLPRALRVQDRIGLSGAGSGSRPDTTPPAGAPSEALRVAAAHLISDNGIPPADVGAVERFRHVGLLAPSLSYAAVLDQGFAVAEARIRGSRRPGQVVNGWIYPKADLGDYGTDYAYRASVAINGLGAMVPAEAMYLRSAAPTATGLFDGNRLYHLHFAAQALPPVNAFWSLSMYERTPDGGFYFIANPLKRFSFGDRTAGQRRNPDGSLDVWIGHADPGSDRRSNWLPAPAGPFALSLRAYLPKAALLDGSWQAPAVEAAN